MSLFEVYTFIECNKTQQNKPWLGMSPFGRTVHAKFWKRLLVPEIVTEQTRLAEYRHSL